MKNSYVIYGAGGHAKVIVDLILELGGEIKCVFDDKVIDGCSLFMNIPIKKYNAKLHEKSLLIIAIGDNQVRKNISKRLTHNFASLVHPKAWVSKSASVGKGTVILANAVIQADACIGDHVIVNAGACVDHEANISDFVHISPMAYIGGNTSITEGVRVFSGVELIRELEQLQSIMH